MPVGRLRRMTTMVPPWTRGDFRGVAITTFANLVLSPSVLPPHPDPLLEAVNSVENV